MEDIPCHDLQFKFNNDRVLFKPGLGNDNFECYMIYIDHNVHRRSFCKAIGDCWERIEVY
jgi:hypothetical protein